MATLPYGPAKKFLYTCEPLKGTEVQIKRRNGKSVKGTVIGFGATGSVWSSIRMWANVKDNNTGEIIQVDLMSLYRHASANKSSKKQVAAKHQPEAIAEAETTTE